MGTRLPRGNLRAELTDFVGRRRELSQLRKLLGSNRLVTVTGIGGVGKTRLAFQMARHLRAFPDGTWVVELAAVTDPDLVASSVAGVFEIADHATPSVLAALVDYLRDKQTLLVLDNCEHLLDGCAVVIDALLTAAPGLRVLVTSRQPLGMDAEWVLSLTPLSVPDPESLSTGSLAEFEAVQLLVQRAQAVLPRFEVTAANRTAVALICRRMDGLPLAIELAAAWLRVLPAEQLLSRLDESPHRLWAGSRVGPERQRTLQATLDWSYHLCSAQEQAMWAEMSVFAGGFDLAAAERVCGGDGGDATEVFDVVAGLVDKSLLIREPESDAVVRYGLLETVREYGHRRLIDSGKRAELIYRHREYYRRFVRQADAGYLSSHQVQWMLRLRREYPNVRAAIQSALAEPDAGGVALEIAVAARDLWYGTGRYREGQRWMTQALARDPTPTALRGVALAEAGYVALRLGDPVAGERMLAEAHVLDERLQDPALHACVTHFAGAAALIRRPPDLSRAADLIQQAVAAAEACGDLRRLANSLLLLATVAAFAKNPQASEYAERCRALSERHGATWTQSWATAVLALTAWTTADHDRADALAREALPVMLHLHDSWGAGICLAILAWVASATGGHERAAGLLGACHAIKRRDGATLAEEGPFAEHHERCVRDTRNGLGKARYAAVFDEASRYSLDEAAAVALGATGHGIAARSGPPSPLTDPLTRREQQIAELIAEGMTNNDIATHLVISRRTAESHTAHILTKLGFTARAQIIGWVNERRHSTDASR